MFRNEGPDFSPPMTHYQCIRFDPQSEVEFKICKFKKKRPDKKAKKKQDHTESNLSNGTTCDDFAPIGTVFFTLLSGRAESFGIPITAKRIYLIDLNQRFVLQTFESGFELCFLVQNYAENDILEAKDGIQFVSLKSPFTSFNLKTLTLDSELLLSLVQHDSRESQLPHNVTIWIKKNVHERYRFDINTKCYQNKISKWLYPKYVEIAHELNRQRQEATRTNRIGSNVIIVGPCNAGKSTLAKLIINYAINEQYSPMYVDLDVGQGAIGVPGMIGAGIIDKHCQLEQDYQFRSGYPIQVHYGVIDPGSDKNVHQLSVNCLAAQIEHFLQSEEEQQGDRPNQTKIPKRTLTKWSGLVINTHGWIDGYGYESTLDAIHRFSVSEVLILGEYKLYERIHKDLIGVHPVKSNQNKQSNSTNLNVTHNSSSSKVMVHFFKHNSSAIKRSPKLRSRLRMNRFARYFFGNANALTTVSIPFDNHSIFRFYSWNSFSRFLKSEQKPKLNQYQSDNLPSLDQANTANYKICKVERDKICKNRSELNYDRVVFYHLNREMMSHLTKRVLSVLKISMEQLNDQLYCFPLRELLRVHGHARVVDIETDALKVELPVEYAQILFDGKLVFVLNEAIFDPKE